MVGLRVLWGTRARWGLCLAPAQKQHEPRHPHAPGVPSLMLSPGQEPKALLTKNICLVCLVFNNSQVCLCFQLFWSCRCLLFCRQGYLPGEQQNQGAQREGAELELQLRVLG